MPEYLAPGVYVEEVDTGPVPIGGVGTRTAGFLGPTERGTTDPEVITSFGEYQRKFGSFGLYRDGGRLESTYLAYGVDGFFKNGGSRCYIGRITPKDTPTARAVLSPPLGAPEPRANELGMTPSGDDPETEEVEPPSIAFGEVVAGLERIRTVTLTNLGEAGDESVTIQRISVESDAEDSPFEVEDVEREVLAPGTQRPIEVTFTPSEDDTGEQTATLAVNHTGRNEIEITLTGTGVEPPAAEDEIEVRVTEPADGSLGFGPVVIGKVETRRVTVVNMGGPEADAIEIMASVESDAEDSGFQASFAGPIAPGDETPIEVTFAPTNSEDEEATLVISYGDEGRQEVSLSGLVTVVEVTPQRLSFGTQEDTQSITVANRGEEEAAVSASLDPEDGPFELGSVSEEPLASGEETTIDVTFDPTDVDPTAEAVGTLTVTGGDDDFEIGLEGGNAAIEIRAVGPGVWGGNIAVIVEEASQPQSDFKLTVRYWTHDEAVTIAEGNDANPDRPKVNDPDKEEVYDNLSADETDSDYYENRINGISHLIEVERMTAGRPAPGVVTWLNLPTPSRDESSLSLRDYTGDESKPPGERTGLAAFKEVDEIAIVCAPDEVSTPGLAQAVVNHCETMKDRFAVLQTNRNAKPTSLPPGDALSQRGYAAIYYPWIEIIDLETNLKKLIPPGGHVAGIYARSDEERGVHKAPANETIRGAQALEVSLTKADQDGLNPQGVNCIRSFPGRGILVWGARTTSSNGLWKYVNVRRLFLFLEESIDEGTQWAVFEPNDQNLWARVSQSVSNFLTTQWRNGALMGTTPEEAFYVRCDRSTMTQDDIDNGRLIVEIGVAPVKPAEFVIFRITQWTGGQEVA